MPDRERNVNKRRQGLAVSVVVGTLLVPLSAFAASVLVSNDSLVEPSTTSPSVGATEPQAVVALQTGTAADLATACGEAGLLLVDAEADGSISDLQRAALDGLREVCTQQGMSLPTKPVPLDETIVVADVAGSGTGSQSSGTVIQFDDHDDDDDHDDGDDDDDHDDRDDDDDDDDRADDDDRDDD